MPAMDMKAVFSMIARREQIKKEVEPLIGCFDCAEMTADEVALYSCEKLGLKATKDNADAMLTGFLAGRKAEVKHYGLDSAKENKNVNSDIDVCFNNYLKG